MVEEKVMKKILIFSHALELGGAERALLGLLHSLDYEKYEIDLFLMRHQGELLRFLPKQVHLLPEIEAYTCLAVPIADVIKKKRAGVLLGRINGKRNAKKFIRQNALPVDNGVELEYSHKYTRKYMPKINEKEYDLAISFLTPHYFVDEKVNAKKKIAWIHTDYSNIELDIESEFKMWNAYDHIVSISDACTRGFCYKFPGLEDKIIRIDNIIPAELIKEQAEAFDVFKEMPEDGSIRILSVGRFCNAKNFDSVPNICSLLLKIGLNIKWYLIGFGPDEMLIREKIQEANMEDRVIVLGKKINPYPYMKACDLYVQPSRYEGNCVSVHEAQVLGKPVIITDYATAKNQLNDEVDGVIVPMDQEECAKGIAKVLSDSQKMKGLCENCRNIDFANNKEVEKLYAIL